MMNRVGISSRGDGNGTARLDGSSAAEFRFPLTTILGEGTVDSSLFDVILVSEGFTAGELARFESLCRRFVELLATEPWFDTQTRALRITQIAVSAERQGFGAHVPAGSRQVIFDAGELSLFIDEQLASRDWNLAVLLIRGEQFAATASPSNHSVAVMVRDDRPSEISGKPLWFEYVMHEMGHTAFGLADEYDFYESRANSSAGDFFASMHSDLASPNVTTNPDRSQLKWRELARLSEGRPLCVKNLACDGCPAVPVPALPIGMFEGGHYRPAGVFRPALTCRMRELGQPFCRVCAQAIHTTLRRFHQRPMLAAELSRVSFGNLLINRQWTLPLAVSNVGTGAVTDLRCEIVEDVADQRSFSAELTGDSRELAEGEWRIINVCAGPIPSAGRRKGTLRLLWGTRGQVLEIPLCACVRNFTDV